MLKKNHKKVMILLESLLKGGNMKDLTVIEDNADRSVIKEVFKWKVPEDKTVIVHNADRPVIKEVFKWEPPKDKTVQHCLDEYRIEEENN